MTKVSVVVITRNRCVSLLRTLDELLRTPERPPVVVVDNASTDGTAEAVRAGFPGVRVIELPANEGSAARTAGVRAVETPYVAFADDDSWWAPGALRIAATTLDRCQRLGVLAARVLVGPEQRLDPTCAAMRDSPLDREPDLPGPSVLGFLACGAVVRRSAYLEVGGFDRRFGVGGEEALLAVDLAEAGWGLAYVEEVVAYHHPEPRTDVVARQRRQLRNEIWWLVMRRPAMVAGRRLLALAPRALRDPVVRGALLDAARQTPAVLRDRRVTSARVEAALCRLEAASAG